jgi:long-chain acyl-CoA synthetase
MLLNEFLERSADSFPDKVALICQGKKSTYNEINQKADSFARSLSALGLQRQERVIIQLENSVECIIALFGILKANGIFVILNPKIKPKKLAYIISDCHSRILVTDANHAQQLREIFQDGTCLQQIILTDMEKYTPWAGANEGTNQYSFNDLVQTAPSKATSTRNIDIDLASLIYTSGSSGNPKGVMLTHLNMVTAANSITQYLDNRQDDIIIDTLPLSFDYGLYQVLMAFKLGATVVLEKGFIFPEQVIKTVVKERVTGWPIVPTIAAMLCRLKNLEKHDFSCLRYISSTGQVLPTNHIARLREVFPGVKIYSMYGLTECKRVSYLSPDQLDKRPGSVGKAIPNTEVYIVDEAGEIIQEPGKSGELVVRGSTVMRGYWGLPEETKRALRPGLYPGELVLYTGDLFKQDEEGYLYFLGRKDDIIKTSGHMVSPKEVENVLCEIDDVVEAAVIGIADDVLGSSVKAFVCLSAGSRLTEKEILDFCYKNMEDYAVPKSVVIRDSLPRTDSGKIQKRELI